MYTYKWREVSSFSFIESRATKFTLVMNLCDEDVHDYFQHKTVNSIAKFDVENRERERETKNHYVGLWGTNQNKKKKFFCSCSFFLLCILDILLQDLRFYLKIFRTYCVLMTLGKLMIEWCIVVYHVYFIFLLLCFCWMVK